MIATTFNVIERLPFDKYRELPGENVSGLVPALTSALLYRENKLVPTKDKDTYRQGRAGHTAILEPERFLSDFVQWETSHADGKKRIRSGNEWEAFELEASSKGKTILTPAQFKLAMHLRDAVRDHPIAGPYVKGPGRNELTITWTDKRTGMLCKGRIDRLTHVLLDVKLTHDTAIHPFISTSTRLHYPMRLAFYFDGLRTCGIEVAGVKIIAAQSKAPYDVAVYNVGPDELRGGREKYELALDVVREARSKNKWPGHAEEHEIEYISPAWAIGGDEAVDFGDEVIA